MVISVVSLVDSNSAFVEIATIVVALAAVVVDLVADPVVVLIVEAVVVWIPVPG